MFWVPLENEAMKRAWPYLLLTVFWLVGAVLLGFGWLPRPGGGGYQSTVAAVIALLMAAWNVLRVWLVVQKKRAASPKAE